MQDKELLEQLKKKTSSISGGGDYEEYDYTPEEHAAILSLLSQQEVVSQADEEILMAIEDIYSCLVEAPVDFLGTGYNSKAADQEHDEWRHRWESAIKLLRTKVLQLSQQQQQRQYSEEDMINFAEFLEKEAWLIEYREQRDISKQEFIKMYFSNTNLK